MTSKIKSNDSIHLRQHWTEERAYRTGKALTRAVLLLGFSSLLMNVHYSTRVELLGDVTLIGSCLLALFLTHLQKPRRHFVWWPLYGGFCIATIPSCFLTGGVQSPWLGLYLSCLLILGTVVQTRFKPIYHLALTLSIIAFWTLIDQIWPIKVLITYPTAYVAYSSSLALIGIGYCLHGLIRTERDLSIEIERRYSELFEARTSLLREESANQSKTAFLANISHELRTPLGAILGYAGLLQDPNSTEEDKSHFSQIIERNGQQLSRLVNDILDLAKVEAGCIDLESIECRPRDLVDDVIRLLLPAINSKALAITVKAPADFPVTVLGDPLRLKQIITNILGNAIKFTDSGSITVSLNFKENKLICSVRDTGCGITGDERQRLFKPFSQAAASTTRRYGGTGLGLNFSKQLAKLMNGDLDLIWSEPGRGSEFVFYIPVKLPLTATSPVEPVSTEPVQFDFKDLKILLVDDSEDNRDIVLRYLSPTGAQVTEAANGRECLQKIANSKYDLILMDIQMPEIDGLQATHILREQDFNGPIIALTAHAMKEDRERCLQAGCSNHLAKPLDRKELLEAIHVYKVPRENLSPRPSLQP